MHPVDQAASPYTITGPAQDLAVNGQQVPHASYLFRPSKQAVMVPLVVLKVSLIAMLIPTGKAVWYLFRSYAAARNN
jgi:hypothetical protein